MKRATVVVILLLCSGCGFISDPRVCEEYGDHCWPDDETVLLATWPFHVAMMAGCATLDQGVRTFECAPAAGIDAYDYLRIGGDGNNIMFDRTVAVPKTLATPVVLAGSYAARWAVPIDNDERLFEVKD